MAARRLPLETTVHFRLLNTDKRDRNKGPDESVLGSFYFIRRDDRVPELFSPMDVQVTVLQVWDAVEPPLSQQHQQTAAHAGDMSQDHAAVALPSLLPIPLAWGNKGSLL